VLDLKSAYVPASSLARAIAMVAYSRHNAGLLIGRRADATGRGSTAFGITKCAGGQGLPG
jgi:hypothetical protein